MASAKKSKTPLPVTPHDAKGTVTKKAAALAADDLVNAGSEYSFPASDPPSYMGGTAVIGKPLVEEPAREPAVKVPSDPCEVSPAGEAPQGTDPARVYAGEETNPGEAEAPLRRAHYCITRLDDGWRIRLDEEHFGPYRTREEALTTAIGLAHKLGLAGFDTEVMIEDGKGNFASEWRYGRDPNPELKESGTALAADSVP